MYFGISFQTQMKSQAAIASSMIRIGSTHLPMFSTRSARTRRASSGSSRGAARSLVAVMMLARRCIDRADQHVRCLATERGIIRRRAEGVVARIGYIYRDLVEHPARPRPHHHDTVGQE